MHKLYVLFVKCKFLKFPSTGRKVQTGFSSKFVKKGSQYEHQYVQKLIEKQSGSG